MSTWSLRSREGEDTPSFEEFVYWYATPGSWGSVKRNWDDPEYRQYAWGGYITTLGVIGAAGISMGAGTSTSGSFYYARMLTYAEGTYIIATTPALLGAIGLGYAVGAVVGTGISAAVFGEEGRQDATDFYSGRGDYASYFDYSGNFNTIWDHYF